MVSMPKTVVYALVVLGKSIILERGQIPNTLMGGDETLINAAKRKILELTGKMTFLYRELGLRTDVKAPDHDREIHQYVYTRYSDELKSSPRFELVGIPEAVERLDGEQREAAQRLSRITTM